MEIQHVPRQYVQQVWPQVAPLLEAALAHSTGEYNVDQLRGLVASGQQQLMVATDAAGAICGAMTIAFEMFPNEYIAFITATGGRGIITQDHFNQLSAWCKDRGATRIRTACRPEAARLFRRVGIKQCYTMMEARL